MNDMELIESEGKLFDYLTKKFNKLSRNSVKNLLKNRQIIVNGKVVTQYDYLLKKGDKISFNGEEKKSNIKIIYEDDKFIVINKKEGILTVASEKEKDKTMYRLVKDYLLNKGKKENLFVVHRLDKDTSGVLLFCKDEKLRNALQESWNEIVKKREYVALVEGKFVGKTCGTLTTYLKETKTKVVYSSFDKEEGLKAITHYKVLNNSFPFSLVQVELETGRKNQIRVHLSDLGHPVAGDKKYGAKQDPLKRLALHCTKVHLINPIDKKMYCFETSIPPNFTKALD